MHRATLMYAIVALAVFSGGFAIGNSGPAIAHSTGLFDTAMWASDPTLRFGYLGSELNTSQAKSRLMTADNEWDSVSGAWLDFIDNWSPDASVSASATCTSSSVDASNTVFYIEDSGASGSSYATATRCLSSTNRIESALIRFNTNHWADWYTGTGGNGSLPDLWGVATHELGHAAGWKTHFSSSDTVCTGSPKHTMCPSWSSASTDWARTLETHDEHTFSAQY